MTRIVYSAEGETEESEPWYQYASVPSACEIIYYDPVATTTNTPVAVPYGWLESDALDILEANGWDYAATAEASAANGRPVWECYVSDLSTHNVNSEFKVGSISIVDGKVQVDWTPDLNENGTKTERSYKVLGKRTLADEEWVEVSADANVDEEGWRFFRVRVAMPEE